MRTLFIAFGFMVLAYLVYNDFSARFILGTTFLLVAGDYLITFMQEFIIEFRKELEDRKNND